MMTFREMHPDAPEWATDKMFSRIVHKMPLWTRLQFVFFVLVGFDVTTNRQEWCENEPGRIEGWVELDVTTYPRWWPEAFKRKGVVMALSEPAVQ